MGRLAELLGPEPEQSPFQKGMADAKAGKQAPPFPAHDSGWNERLYSRGFDAYYRRNKVVWFFLF